MRWLAAVVGLAAAVYATYVVLGQASSGVQPWSSELSDNFILAKLVPFALGFGVVAGLLRGSASRPERRADGATRRFTRWTVVMHLVITIGIVLALPTGMWQYMGGVLNAVAPIPLYWIYRIHYIGALIVLFAVAAFAAAWWYSGERSLLVPRGAWKAHIRGFVAELPPQIATLVARVLRVDLRVPPPAPGRFAFYETVFSFPTWTVAIALITVTGLVKALRYVYEVPGPVIWWSSTLHVTAMVLIALKTLDHLRYSLDHWPLVGAIFTGWLKQAPPDRAPVAAAGRAAAGAEGEE